MTVWRIEGQASNEAGGGEIAIFAVTPSDTKPPDPHASLSVALPDYGWYLITSITRVGAIPEAWDENDGEPVHWTEALRDRID